VNREKLKKLVDFSTTTTSTSSNSSIQNINELFEDVPEDFKHILFSYLLPILQEQTNKQIQVFARHTQRLVMDIKISSLMTTTCSSSSSSSSSSNTTSMFNSSQPLSPSTLLRLNSNSSTTTSSSISISNSTTNHKLEKNPYEFHYFDMVDGNKIQQHGARELHPTKAVYVSRSMASIAKRASNTGDKNRSFISTPSGSSGSSGILASGTMAHGSLSQGTPPNAFSTIQEETDTAHHKMKKIVGGLMGGVKDRIHHARSGGSTSSNISTNSSTNKSNTVGVATCEGCGKSPIVGVRWRCRTCLEDSVSNLYELCEKCYGQGMHGKDNEEELFERIMQIVITRCPRLTNEQELMKLLRFGICKTNLKKFSFCLTWISDLIACKNTKELRARALEISQITPKVRSDFVRVLTEVLAFRGDIDLITEWEPVRSTNTILSSNNNTTSNGNTTTSGTTSTGSSTTGGSSSSSTSGGGELDTLRIWVKDKELSSTNTHTNL
jgi:uncharacterized protein YcfL